MTNNSLFKLRMTESMTHLPKELQHPAVSGLILASLAEDLTLDSNLLPLFPDMETGDLTSSATIPNNTILQGMIRAKQDGVVAGLPIARAVFHFLNADIKFDSKITDGKFVHTGDVIADVTGSGTSILAGERTALNFLGRLSGIATLTQKYVEAVQGTGATILDTRKTAPGSRLPDKYAVRMGGGTNHRMGLYDMVLIKDNHIDGAGGIEAAVQRVRRASGMQIPVEVEVKNMTELEIALNLPIERIMLDNMTLSAMRQAVAITNKRIPLEASGNVTLETVRDIAETGVDFISAGALTHSAPAFDISMRLS